MRKRDQAVLIVGLAIFFAVFALRTQQSPQSVHDGKTVGQWLAQTKVAVGVVRLPGRTLIFPAGMTDEELVGMTALIATNRNARVMGGGSGFSSTTTFFFEDGEGQIEASSYSVVEKDAASEALKSMGVQAVPYLKDQLHRRNSKVTVWCFHLWRKLPVPARSILHPPQSAEAQRARAAHALGRLGPKAKDAVPDLLKSTGSDESPLVRSVASEAINRIAR